MTEPKSLSNNLSCESMFRKFQKILNTTKIWKTQSHLPIYFPTLGCDGFFKKPITWKYSKKKPITLEIVFPASGCDWFTRHPRFLRRVILKTHHILRVVASPKKWLVFVGISNLANPWLIFGISKNCDGFFKKPITICSAQPKKFGDQSPYPPGSQKNLATNHPIHPLAKKIWRPITLSTR